MVGMMPTTVCLYFMFFEFSENSNFKMLLVEFCGFVLLHMVDCEKLGRILWLLSSFRTNNINFFQTRCELSTKFGLAFSPYMCLVTKCSIGSMMFNVCLVSVAKGTTLSTYSKQFALAVHYIDGFQNQRHYLKSGTCYMRSFFSSSFNCVLWARLGDT